MKTLAAGMQACPGRSPLTAAVVGPITGGMAALAVLVAATLALWLTATARHAFAAPRGPVHGRDAHEVV
jgi:hypothetical protein